MIRAFAVVALFPALLAAQTPAVVPPASLVGRVVDEAQKRGLPDVQLSIFALNRGTLTDSTGSFRMDDLPAGLHFVVLRKIGYEAQTVSIAFEGASTVERTIAMKKVAVLDTISVRESPLLAEFDDNRRLGLGKFLTPEDIEKLQGTAIGSRLSEFPSAAVIRGRSNAAWLAAKRPRTMSGIQWCPTGWEEDSRAPCGCYAQVYVDNMLMNPQVTRVDRGKVSRVTPPFDVNSLLTTSMYAVEWYAGSTQTPSRYNRPGSECGVLVVHMKRGK
jgi:hypothetical protein